MEAMKYMVMCFILACNYANGTNVHEIQDTRSSCRSYGRCYNPSWCDGVLSSRNCSQKHLVNKLECLSALLEDKSYDSDWSDTIKDLTENVTVMMNQTGNIKTDMLKFKNTCNSTLSELSTRHKNLKEAVNTLNSESNDLKRGQIDIQNKMSDFDQYRENTDKTVETLRKDVSKTDKDFKSFESKTSLEHKQMEERITGIDKHVNGRIDSSETDLQNKMSDFDQYRVNTDKTIESLKKDLKNTDDDIKSFESTTNTDHKKMEEKVTGIDKHVNGRIESLETNLKALWTKEIQTTNATISAIEEKMLSNQDQINRTLNSLNKTISINEVKLNNSLGELRKEMIDGFDNTESERKRLEKEIKDMKSEVDNVIKEKTQNVKDQLTGDIDKMSKQVTEKINSVSTSTSSKMKDSDSKIAKLSKDLEESKRDFGDKLKSETDKLQENTDKSIGQLNTELETFKTNTNTVIGGIETNIQKLMEKVDGVESENNRKIQEVKESLTTMIKGEISELKASLNKSVKETKETIDELRTDIGKQIIKVVEALTMQTLEVNQTVSQQQKIVDVIYPNTFNKGMFSLAFLLLVVLVGVNFTITYILVKRSSPQVQAVAGRTSTDGSQHAAHTGEEPHSPVEVYNRLTYPNSLPIELSAPLEDSVAVVSFYEDAQKHHKLLMKDVLDLADVRVLYHVIRRHEHIPQIPRAKLCIMFVEFSERHVIIEEPGLGLGDLKRKTVKFINTLGACLVIVYVKDPGSRRLRSSELYNSSIYCVKNQPELSELSKTARFLSVYDNFNEYQVKRLADVILANVCQRSDKGQVAGRSHTGSPGKLHLRLN